ncbi:MAG: VWA domain-containing protein [Alistipes sp.]|nr:VWA domain-containing protein [Alistipes sp.]
MFRFAHPHYLWLLWAIPAMILLFLWAAHHRHSRLARFGRLTTLEELMPDLSTARIALKFILFVTAYGFLILAAARPQFGSKLREEKAEGVEMMLVVDVSNSMLAEDFAPNRLERTKYAINKLFEGMRQDRVGLVVFAGEPKVQLPITSDYRMAKAFARRIDPSLVQVQGTAVGKALEQALLSFSGETVDEEEGRQSRVIILITDGENHEDDAIATAQKAAEMGIRIYTIGIGTPEGAPIRIGGDYIQDEKGEMVVSKLNEEMLTEIAKLTGGLYVRSTLQSIGLEEIVKSIEAMEKSELSTIRFEEYDEQYRLPLAIALVLLLIELLLLDRRNPLLAHLNIFREERR